MSSDSTLNTTPTTSSAMAKCTTCGCRDPIGGILRAQGAGRPGVCEVPRDALRPFSDVLHITVQRENMHTFFRGSGGALLFLLLARTVFAEGQSAVILADPDPPAWDVSGHLGWLSVNKSGIAPDWNRWYDAAAAGVSV